MSGALEFEPDRSTLELLSSEHENGTWVGRELLPIANRIRALGGTEDDYRRWVLASHLWLSYVGSTSDRPGKQRSSLEGAWRAAERSKPFDLEEALTDLRGRIATWTGWVGRTGSRNRAVALALVTFCIEHNCFTRTLSTYELAKYTSAMSPQTVGRALRALSETGLLDVVDRTDRRTSTRSTNRYRINLHWKPPTAIQAERGVVTTGSMNTGKNSLLHDDTPPLDIWSRRGLGPGAQRVHEALPTEPTTVRQVSEITGQSVASVKRYLRILADHALAGFKPAAPGAPTLWFRVETPLDAVADALGIYGHVEVRRWELEQRQAANRAAYPSAYRRQLSTN